MTRSFSPDPLLFSPRAIWAFTPWEKLPLKDDQPYGEINVWAALTWTSFKMLTLRELFLNMGSGCGVRFQEPIPDFFNYTAV